MNRRHKIYAIILMSPSALLVLSGCAMFEATYGERLYSARLDDRRSMTLYAHTVKTAFTSSARYNFTELRLNVCSEKQIIASSEFGRRPLAHDSRWEDQGYRFPHHHLDGRTDNARRRFWIVDRTTEQVIVTYDSDTGQIVGIGHRIPGWASPRTGIQLTSDLSLSDSLWKIVAMRFGDHR